MARVGFKTYDPAPAARWRSPPPQMLANLTESAAEIDGILARRGRAPSYWRAVMRPPTTHATASPRTPASAAGTMPRARSSSSPSRAGGASHHRPANALLTCNACPAATAVARTLPRRAWSRITIIAARAACCSPSAPSERRSRAAHRGEVATRAPTLLEAIDVRARTQRSPAGGANAAQHDHARPGCPVDHRLRRRSDPDHRPVRSRCATGQV